MVFNVEALVELFLGLGILPLLDLSYHIIFSDPFQKLCFGHAVDGVEDPVIVEDLKLALVVVDGHEKVEVLLAGELLSARLVLGPPLLAHVVGRRRPMVPIGNVCMRHFLKLLLKEDRVFNGAAPECMLIAIFTCDMGVHLSGSNDLLESLLDVVGSFEGHEDGTDVSILHISQVSSILFLLVGSLFMSLDEILLVIFDGSPSHDPELSSLSHLLHVYVHPRLRILLQEPIALKHL